jgi:outer membrane protein assembly factor BamB
MRALLALALLASAGEETPLRPFGFRGDGTGLYPAATPPLEWSATKNVLWSAKVGKSYSSPILAGSCVLVASEPDLLLCLDRADGRERWRQQVKPSDLADAAQREAAEAYKAKDTGMTAATPVSDGRNVWAAFANGIVRCISLEGKTAWTAYIEARQNTSYGRSASPILFAGRLFVHMTHLYAFDPATGKRLWVNEDAKGAYGTPAGFRQGGVDLVLTPAGEVVRADTGLSVNSGIGRGFHSSPVVADGVIYYAEREVRALRLDAAFKDETRWSGEHAGEIFGSPVVHGGLLFLVTGRGDLSVFDAQGKAAVDARTLFGDDATPETVYASPTLAGRHLYVATTTGEVLVLEATREAKEVARNRLKDGTGSTPVFSGGELYLRDGESLYCIGRR